MLEITAKVSHAEGLDRVLSQLLSQNSNVRKGALYELWVAATYSDLVEALREEIEYVDEGGLKKTDIDIKLKNDTLIQAKAWEKVSYSRRVVEEFKGLIAIYRQKYPSATIVFIFGCSEDLVDERIKSILHDLGVIIKYLKYVGL